MTCTRGNEPARSTHDGRGPGPDDDDEDDHDDEGEEGGDSEGDD